MLEWLILGGLGVLAAGCGYLYEQSSRLKVTRARTFCPVEKPLRLVHLSDLHARSFGPGNRRLAETVRAQKPDLVCFTGDLVNRDLRGGKEAALALMERLAALCPVAVVFGNHEVEGGQVECLEKELEARGVRALVNQEMKLELKGQTVWILGLQERWEPPEHIAERVEKLGEKPGLWLLLSHYPHYFVQPPYRYRDRPVHLMLAGHTHGGQLRLPLLGAVFCPGQGWFPRYDKGVFRENGVTLVVSGGLGRFPRTFNPPEVGVLELLPEALGPEGKNKKQKRKNADF